MVALAIVSPPSLGRASIGVPYDSESTDYACGIRRNRTLSDTGPVVGCA